MRHSFGDWKGIGAYRAQLRFCLRVTASMLAAFAVAQAMTLPLHGLWMILTAVVVTQMSMGGSMRATLEYIAGTLGGAVYAGILGALVPHSTVAAQAAVLTLAVAPLGLAAAFNPNFRVAPFSAVLVLLIAGQFGEGPIESAITRTSEVALGGVIAVVVSLVVFPEHAYRLGRNAAAGILRQMAGVLAELMTGFMLERDPAEFSRLQDRIGAAVAEFQRLTAEMLHERVVTLTSDPDPAPLSRTLLRLRHDFVILGRAAVTPLPDILRARLAAPLQRVGAAAGDFLNTSASALAQRKPSPPLDEFEAALAAYIAEVEAVRGEGLTLPLTSNEVEPVFALGFALDQMRQNFIDLRRCVQDYAQPLRRNRSS